MFCFGIHNICQAFACSAVRNWSCSSEKEIFFQRFKAAVYQICDGGVVRNFLPSKSTNFYQNHLNFGKQVIFEYSAAVLILFFYDFFWNQEDVCFQLPSCFFSTFLPLHLLSCLSKIYIRRIYLTLTRWRNCVLDFTSSCQVYTDDFPWKYVWFARRTLRTLLICWWLLGAQPLLHFYEE